MSTKKTTATKSKKAKKTPNENIVLIETDGGGTVAVDAGPPTPNYARKVILAPGGSKRRELPLNEVVIPDLWHHAQKLQELSDAVERAKIDPEDEELQAEFSQEVAEGRTVGARMKEQVLEVLFLAHDLKKNLANDVE